MIEGFDPGQITFKITEFCNASCYHCRYRRELYTKKKFDFENLLLRTKNILEFFKSSKLHKVTFSGGEPSSVKDLKLLVKLAADYVKNITVITNGWNNDIFFWQGLIENGLTHVDVSIDGFDETSHDWIRNKTGLYRRIKILMPLLDRLCINFPGFGYSIITIVSNFNIMKLETLLKFITEHNVARWILHYPECDSDNIFSPSSEKQKLFRKKILPKLKQILKETITSKSLLENAYLAIDKLYNPSLLDTNSLTKGIYHRNLEEIQRCRIPEEFLLVKYNGKVYMCPGGEYSTNGCIGHYNNKKQMIVFKMDEFNTFMKKRINYCSYCPVPHTIRLLLK